VQRDVKREMLNLFHHLLASLRQVVAQLWPAMQIAAQFDCLVEHVSGLLKHADRCPVSLARAVGAAGLRGFGHV